MNGDKPQEIITHQTPVSQLIDKQWWNVIMERGISTALVVFFLGVFTGWIPSPLLDHVAFAKLQYEGIRSSQEALKMQYGEIVVILRQICHNTATSQSQHDKCN